MTRFRYPVLVGGVLLLVAAVLPARPPDLTPEEAREIAREAYTWGYPMLENYKVLYAYSRDEGGPQYKAPLNVLRSEARLYTPADTAVVTPNSDTPYSFVVMDLSVEPLVLTVPEMEEERYFSIQLIDLYTHNFAYIGTRTTGNGGGTWLVAGPDWKGEAPEGITDVIPCETRLAFAVYRTQLFAPDDMDRVKEIQAGYLAQPLSAFLGEPRPAAGEAIAWPKPVGDIAASPAAFSYLNFLTRFAPVHPSERERRARFARIGVEEGRPFDVEALDPPIREALQAGIDDAWNDFAALQERMAGGSPTSGDLFGTREFLKNNYLYRLAGAKIGLYGNSREEALYPIYFTDSEARPLDASQASYTVRMEDGELPPARAFWSFTMYDGKTQLLVDNPLDRYLINSAMLDGLKRGDDGSITLYVSKDSPGPGLESNWLPAPGGPFYVVLRIYIPEAAALDGSWKQPPLVRDG